MTNQSGDEVVTKETDTVMWTVRMPRDLAEALDREAARRSALAGIKASRNGTLLAVLREVLLAPKAPAAPPAAVAPSGPVSAPLGPAVVARPPSPEPAPQPAAAPVQAAEPDVGVMVLGINEPRLRKRLDRLVERRVFPSLKRLYEALTEHLAQAGETNPRSGEPFTWHAVKAWHDESNSWASAPGRLKVIYRWADELEAA